MNQFLARVLLDTLLFALFNSVKFAGFGLLDIYIKDAESFPDCCR